MNLFLQLMVDGIVNGALYAMLAVGFGIVWRSFRVFHIAYGGLYVACAYAFYVSVEIAHIPVAVSVMLTLVFAALAGWFMEFMLYRPFYRKVTSPHASLIASLGVFIVIENLVSLIFGNELKGVSSGLARTLKFGPTALTTLQLLELVVGGMVVILFWVLVRRLRTFKALWAMGDQPQLIPLFRQH